MKGTKVSGHGAGQDDGPWVEVCRKTNPVKENALVPNPALDEADRAAWHIWKSTDRPARVRAIEKGVYAVDFQPEIAPSPCDECGGGEAESYMGENCPCELVANPDYIKLIEEAERYMGENGPCENVLEPPEDAPARPEPIEVNVGRLAGEVVTLIETLTEFEDSDDSADLMYVAALIESILAGLDQNDGRVTLKRGPL